MKWEVGGRPLELPGGGLKLERLEAGNEAGERVQVGEDRT
jgi:hypothetical protein